MNNNDPRIPEVTRLHHTGYSTQAIAMTVHMALKTVERVLAKHKGEEKSFPNPGKS